MADPTEFLQHYLRQSPTNAIQHLQQTNRWTTLWRRRWHHGRAPPRRDHLQQNRHAQHTIGCLSPTPTLYVSYTRRYTTETLIFPSNDKAPPLSSHINSIYNHNYIPNTTPQTRNIPLDHTAGMGFLTNEITLQVSLYPHRSQAPV
jgi:hypothetical protein